MRLRFLVDWYKEDRTMPQLRGIIHGKTIELDAEPGLPDGEPVSVTVQRLLPAGEGIRQSAGAWADAGDDLESWFSRVEQLRGH
jgi:hypothetical protein